MFKNCNFIKQDEYRNKLSQQNKLIELKKSYLNKKNKNTNTSKFWNNKIARGNKLDSMSRDRINSSINLVKEKKGNLLDIGLGYGDFEKLLYKKNKELSIYGIDISSKGIKKIKNTIPGIYKVGSVLNIPFNNNKFDVVVALETLEHITSNEIFTAYKEINRVLKKKGTFIASVPVNEKISINANPNHHMRVYATDLFCSELTLAGYKVNKIKKFYAFKKLYILKKIVQKLILRNKWKPNILLVSCTKK